MGFKMKKKCFSGKTHESAQMLGNHSIMLRWRSSLWKLIWKELLVYVVVFITISVIYRLALEDDDQREFEKLVKWCQKYHSAGVPLTFLLGFYVSLIVRRWWDQYTKLPWPDSIAYLLRTVVIEKDEVKARTFRRTIVRYCMLSYVLCMRRNSLTIQKRFPTVKDIVKSRLIREDEAKRIGFEDGGGRFESKWWLPLKWSSELTHKALTGGIITSASGYTNLIIFISKLRDSLNEVESYGHVAVPLVYTQVVTLAVYVYFVISLISEQVLLEPVDGEKSVHVWIPIFLSLKFLFFFGWLKVAETLYNPFGDDDEDFKMNELIDRHAEVMFEIIEDETGAPELMEDDFNGNLNRPEGVYTVKVAEGELLSGDADQENKPEDGEETKKFIQGEP